MITRILAIVLTGFLSCAVFADDNIKEIGASVHNDDLLIADNRRKGRRDDRQEDRDDKQDCRQEEGRVGDDKRECKQENRGDGDEEEEAEAEEGAEAEAEA